MIFKIQWVQENQGVMFLVVPPKDMLALVVFCMLTIFSLLNFGPSKSHIS